LLWYWYPVDYYWDFGYYYNNTAELIEYIQQGVEVFSTRFKKGDILSSFDYQVNITNIEAVKFQFGSDDYDNAVGQIVDEMWYGLENVIFQNFDIEPPETSGHETTDERNVAFFNVFQVVWTYFYVAAGVMVIMLAISEYFPCREVWY